VEAVTTLQDKLPLLEKLCLASVDGKRAAVWLEMHKNLRAAFLTFLRLPTLKEVNIQHIADFPLSAFDECQNITRLLLRGKFRHSDSEVRPSYPPLDFLSLQSCLPTIIPWIRSHSPRSLDFRVDNWDMFQDVLQVSNTLTMLNVDFSHYIHCTHFFPYHWSFIAEGLLVNTIYDLISGVSSSIVSVPFNLGSLSSLQQLSIHASMRFSTDFFVGSTGSDMLETRRYYSPLPAVVQALLTLPSSCPLKVVTLYFDISVTSAFNLSEIDWSPLFSRSLFSIIRQIDLRIKATAKGNLVPPPTIMSSLIANARLMRLVEQRLLMVKVEGFGDAVDILSEVGR